MLKRAMLATGLGPAMLWLLSSRVDLAREARCRVETRDKTRAHVLQAIEAAKTAGGQPNMVSAMFEAEDPEHGKLTAKEIEEEFITLRGAGHETTSNTTSWVMLLLARNPDVQRRVRAEVEAHVAGRTVTFDETEKLRLCRMTVFEALRLYPTVPAYPRLSVAPTKFGDYDLPTGSFVAVSQVILRCWFARTPQSKHGKIPSANEQNLSIAWSCYAHGNDALNPMMTFDDKRQHKINIRVVRTFNTYGPRMLLLCDTGVFPLQARAEPVSGALGRRRRRIPA